MPLFRRSPEDPAEAAAPDAHLGRDQVAIALEHFAGLPLPQRAAELLRHLAPAIEAEGNLDPKTQNMGALLAPLIPPLPDVWGKLSEQQRGDWAALKITLAEGFQALVQTRMLVRLEEPRNQIFTTVYYANSRDGLAALERGDVAEVVARRLGD